MPARLETELAPATALTPLQEACRRRGALFADCFERYAAAMQQLTHALGQYETVLRDGPRWARG